MLSYWPALMQTGKSHIFVPELYSHSQSRLMISLPPTTSSKTLPCPLNTAFFSSRIFIDSLSTDVTILFNLFSLGTGRSSASQLRNHEGPKCLVYGEKTSQSVESKKVGLWKRISLGIDANMVLHSQQDLQSIAIRIGYRFLEGVQRAAQPPLTD